MTITNEILMRTKPIIITWLAMFYCTAYAQVKSGLQEFRDGDALWRQTVNDESIMWDNGIVLADLSNMEVISDNHRMAQRLVCCQGHRR